MRTHDEWVKYARNKAINECFVGAYVENAALHYLAEQCTVFERELAELKAQNVQNERTPHASE